MNALMGLLGALIYFVIAMTVARIAGRCIDEMGGPDDE